MIVACTKFRYLGTTIKRLPDGQYRISRTGQTFPTAYHAKEHVASTVFGYRYTGIPIRSG